MLQCGTMNDHMNDQPTDLVVIGAGIAGLGVARAAVQKGMSVVLFDAGSIAGATSANSLRIMHGGFRYLQSLNLARTWSSLCAQVELLTEFPDLIKPLPCLMPLAGAGMKSRYPVAAAAAVYGVLQRLARSPLPHPRVQTLEQVLSRARHSELLRDIAVPHWLVWYDALLGDPQLLAERLRDEILRSGGAIFESTPVTAVRRATHSERFVVEARHGNSDQHVSARLVVNAGAAGGGAIPRPADLPAPQTKWCRAFNVVIRHVIDPDHALALECHDGGESRLFFAVPRNSATAIGTGYLPLDAQVGSSVSDAEVAAFLAAYRRALPGLALGLEDVLAVEVGLLPIVDRAPAVAMRREGDGIMLRQRALLQARCGWGDLIGTKYTVFAPQGRAMLDAVLRSSPSAT